MKGLKGNTALDTSALIEFLTGTKAGEIIKTYFKTLKPEETTNCSIFIISEVFYVLCRLKGTEFAEEKVNDMLKSKTLQVYNTTDVAIQTGKIKCERAMSLADCSCIAAAKLANAKAVFARKEKELAREMKRKPFTVEITFLQK